VLVAKISVRLIVFSQAPIYILFIYLKVCVLRNAITDVYYLFVTEGGRLERELRYTSAALGEDASGTTHQLVIQTPRNAETSVLQPAALLAHLDVVRAAAAVSVHMFDM
jgi:hypothetical protein